MEMTKERLSKLIGREATDEDVHRFMEALSPMLNPCEHCANYQFCFKRLDLYADAQKLLSKYTAYGIKAILVSPIECDSLKKSEKVVSLANS